MSLARRLAVLVPLCAVVAFTGCRARTQTRQTDVYKGEQQSEIQRLSSALDALQQENNALKQQRDEALAGQQSVGGQLSGILAGGEISGVYQTDRGGIALDEDVVFAKGSADLSDEGQKAVATLADRLNKGEYASARIIVEGHTDDTPVSRAATKEKYGDNWGLSAARAATVVRALQKAGVDASRLYGAFRGEHDPRTGAKDKGSNRRVELYVK